VFFSCLVVYFPPCSLSLSDARAKQLPYDSAFAIVRDANAHRHAMDITASYLTHTADNGRNPTQFNPELSRRARGFAAWAVLQAWGKEGITEMIRRHCSCATLLCKKLGAVEGIRVCNPSAPLNQVVLRFGESDDSTEKVTALINEAGHGFVRTAQFQGVTCMRVSIISQTANATTIGEFATNVAGVWDQVNTDLH
jgi:glutamate/tyrosine decarboxylase-like PLP-dependent enzyme